MSEKEQILKRIEYIKQYFDPNKNTYHLLEDIIRYNKETIVIYDTLAQIKSKYPLPEELKKYIEDTMIAIRNFTMQTSYEKITQSKESTEELKEITMKIQKVMAEKKTQKNEKKNSSIKKETKELPTKPNNESGSGNLIIFSIVLSLILILAITIYIFLRIK